MFCARGAHWPQFRMPLGAIWGTFGTNVNNLKLRFRVGGYAKIKLWRACVSPCFVRSMCRFSGPLFFMIRLMICHNFTNSCLHWKPIFYNILQLFRPSFSSTQKIEKSDWTRNLVGSTCGTSRVRGELGGIKEKASWRHLGASSSRPAGCICETSGKHQGIIHLRFSPLV